MTWRTISRTQPILLFSIRTSVVTFANSDTNHAAVLYHTLSAIGCVS